MSMLNPHGTSDPNHSKALKRFYELKKANPGHFLLYNEESTQRRLDDLYTYIRLRSGNVINTPTGLTMTPIPTTMILMSSYHGKLIQPFLAPVNVSRRMSADFGSVCYDTDDNRRVIYTSMKEEKVPLDITLKFLNKFIEEETNRDPIKIDEYTKQGKITEEESLLLRSSFMNDKFYKKTKMILKGEPMYDKMYTADEARHIVARSLDANHVIIEFTKPKVFLSTILLLLANAGVTNVHLYEFSCNTPLSPSVQQTDYALFGGTR